MPLKKKTTAQYHHGDLATGLLGAVEELAEKFGLEAVSLRACAKILGVSPAAAFRHYRDKRALLTALAAKALTEVSDTMKSAQAETLHDHRRAFLEVGKAYIAFALDKPALFQVMWRRELINIHDESYQAAAQKLGRHLTGGFAGTVSDNDPNNFSSQELLAWSTVHGLASLYVDGPVGLDQSRDERLEQAERVLLALGARFSTL